MALLPAATGLDALAALQGDALATCRGQGLRPVPRSALHVTLAFLGDRDAEDLQSVTAIVRMLAAVTAPIAARSGALLALPDPERARLLATAIESKGRVEAMAADLRTDLIEAKVDFDARDFLPHMTLARARTAVRVGVAPTAVDLALTTIGLYASHLASSGSRYEPLCVAPLAGPEV